MSWFDLIAVLGIGASWYATYRLVVSYSFFGSFHAVPWSKAFVGLSAFLLGLGVFLFDPYLLSILNLHDLLDRDGPWDLDLKVFLLARYTLIAENIASAEYWSKLIVDQVDWVIPLIVTPSAFLVIITMTAIYFVGDIRLIASIIGAGIVVIFLLVTLFHYAVLALLIVVHFTNFWFLILLIVIVQIVRYRQRSSLDP